MRLLTSTRLAALRTAGATGALAFLFALGSCQDPNELGIDLLEDSVPASATFKDVQFQDAELATVGRLDSLLTSNKNTMLVGQLTDATVGTTTASAFAQISPQTSNPEQPLPSSSLVDSLVLYMPYNAFYGTADKRLKINLLELSTGFDQDQAYYGDSPALPTRADLGVLASQTLFVRQDTNIVNRRILKNPVRTGVIAEDTVTRIVRAGDTARTIKPMEFRITNTDLQNRLLRAIGTTQAGSVTALQSVVKGFALVPDAATTGAIVNFTANSTAMRMVLYYRTRDGVDDTVQRAFTFAMGFDTGLGEQRRYHTKLTTTLTPAFAALRTTGGALPVTAPRYDAYVQSGLEVGTRLTLNQATFDELHALKGKIVINRAELIVPVKDYGTGVFPLPAQLYVYQADALGRVLRTDGQPRTVEIAGANPKGTGNAQTFTYDATTKSYRGLLTAWLDAYVNDRLPDQKVRQLVLLPTVSNSPALTLSRAVLNAVPGSIHLKVYYSEIN